MDPAPGKQTLVQQLSANPSATSAGGPDASAPATVGAQAAPLADGLARAFGRRGGGPAPTIHDAATAAVEHKGSGAAVDSGVAARVGAHLGTDFGGVRVHSDPLSQQATHAMGARAFAYGGDVFLGPGEVGSDVGLMAHELTHVAQQGAARQQAVQRAIQVGDASSPAEREAEQVSAEVTSGQHRPGALLVDDGPVHPGQMRKSEFLERLRAEVTAAANDELGPLQSAFGCPYIEQYFGRYAVEPASAGEALLRRFAPQTRGARTASDMIPAIVARVREGVRVWRDTGEAPPDVAEMMPAAARGDPAAGAAQAQALRARDGGETLASLEAELGPGQSLDGATASRMSDALGVDVSSARIHTGAVAARKAADAGALAFAVGGNVVMGSSAPGPGTLEGDALLAHELAHTAQQAGAGADPTARRKPIGAEDFAAEAHADAAATGAVQQLHGGARGGVAQRLGGALKTGLQLQRCPGPVKHPQPPQLTAAQLTARNTLQRLDGLGDPAFRQDVGAMSRQDTDDLLNNIAPADRQQHAALIKRIRNERLVSSAESLSGQLHWAGNSAGDPTDHFQIARTTLRPVDADPIDGRLAGPLETNVNQFAVWVRGGQEPNNTSRMNCWEMIMLAGFRAGVISRAWIVSVHADAAAAGQTAHDAAAHARASTEASNGSGVVGYLNVIAVRLGFPAAQPWTRGTAVPRGSLVFFNGLEHVALATGNVVNGKQEVMSLWIVPFTQGGAFNSATQRTTIEDILTGMGTLNAMTSSPATPTTVKFGPNPW